MARMTLRIGLVALLLVLGACVTETTYPGDPQPQPPRAEPARGPEKADGNEDVGETIKLTKEVMTELNRLVNEEQLIMADKVELDISRIPFHASMVLVNDDMYVETVEVANPGQRAMGMLMRSRAKVPAVDRDWPRLRLGNGIDLVGNREIQVRIYNKINRNRPVFLKIVATGHAVYRNKKTGQNIRKDRIVIQAEVVDGPQGPVFRKSVI